MIAKCCDVVHDKKDSAIDRALAYIHIHFRDKLSIEDCAAAAGLSSGYFSRFFKAKMKISFRLYVRKVRMAEGRRLLMETDQAGLQNYHLNKIFFHKHWHRTEQYFPDT